MVIVRHNQDGCSWFWGRTLLHYSTPPADNPDPPSLICPCLISAGVPSKWRSFYGQSHTHTLIQRIKVILIIIWLLENIKLLDPGQQGQCDEVVDYLYPVISTVRCVILLVPSMTIIIPPFQHFDLAIYFPKKCCNSVFPGNINLF